MKDKICGNCKFLFISGMLKSWEATVGYCLLIRGYENVTHKSQLNSMRHVTESCSKFEVKKKKNPNK